jgi:hypothetical protein
MQTEMSATAYSKVQIGWLRDITSQILNHCLNCGMTHISGNFQSDSWHIRLRFQSIHQAIGKDKIEIKHVAGAEMMADALSNAHR